MADRLTPLDASFLHTETASAHMHVAWRGRFRPDAARPAITLARVQAQVASRLDSAPRFRRRLAFPGGWAEFIAHPVWVDAEHFNVRRHVVALGGDDQPLSQARFDALADTVLSRPLDRMHPLWEIHLAPRLEDGTVGLLMKIHHALVDGKSALAVALLLLDLDPEAPEPPAPPDTLRRGAGPGAARLKVDALVDSGTEQLRALGRAARAAGSPGRLGGTLRRAAMAVGEDVARPAPSSFLAWRRSARRPRRSRAPARAGGGEALLQGLGLLPLPLQAPLARLAASPRMYNLVVSNVPGPRMPVYLLGVECIEVLPAIPLSDGHALSVGVFSLRDRLCFGAYADPEALPQARELPGAVGVAADELIRASDVRAPLRLVA
jgi:hypothetical protein